MKAVQRTSILITCILFYAALPVFSQSSTVVERVTVKSVVGKAEVRSPKTGKWRPARVGMTVKMKWDVRTYVESSVEIGFASGTVITLGENSVVNLSTITKDKGSAATNSNVKVASGEIWANVKKLVNKKSKFSFETPTAVAAIRGTRLGIKVDKKKSVIDVYEGKVSVKNKGSRREVMVSTRNRAVVESGNSEVKTFTFDEVTAEGDTTSGSEIVDIYAADTLAGADTTDQDTGAAVDETDTTASVDTTSDVDTVTEVYLSIESPEDNSVVTSTAVVIKGKATPKAVVSAGGKQTIAAASGSFALTVEVLPGDNNFVVTAQLGNQSKQEQVSFVHEPPKELFLSVTKPTDGMKITEPIIPIRGVTLPGAEVTVNDNAVTVAGDGSFTDQIHIPDEADDYSITLVSEYRGQEKTVTLVVTYEPQEEELVLTITSPKEGQVVAANALRIVGKAAYKAKIEITGGGGTATRAFTIGNSDGAFTCDLQLSERDIGEYTIEITASNEAGDEIDKTLTVEVDINSPAVNTSVPDLNLIGDMTGSTRNGYLTVQVLDRTPEDQITLMTDVNGSRDQYVLEPSEQEKIYLEEGKNRYSFYAQDLAGNKSSGASGEIYYLPGPLTFDILEPDESQYVIDDLPPMPSNTGNLTMDVEIEIDDGIGDVPETILYCRINGVHLRETRSYIYEGQITLVRGVNNFLLETEDTAGNKEKRTFTVTINE